MLRLDSRLLVTIDGIQFHCTGSIRYDQDSRTREIDIDSAWTGSYTTCSYTPPAKEQRCRELNPQGAGPGSLLFTNARMRVRILVDFWNLQLAWNDFHQSRPKIPRDSRFTDVLTRHAGDDAVYTGCHVYASVDPNKPAADVRLRRFLHVMQGFPGYQVIVKERQSRGPFTCPHQDCRKPILDCPHCDRVLRRTVEKGVDTALATDLVELAVDNLFDSAILVSADADFVPAVELVQRRTGKRVIHAYFRPRGQELRNTCWSHMYFDDFMDQLMGSS